MCMQPNSPCRSRQPWYVTCYPSLISSVLMMYKDTVPMFVPALLCAHAETSGWHLIQSPVYMWPSLLSFAPLLLCPHAWTPCCHLAQSYYVHVHKVFMNTKQGSPKPFMVTHYVHMPKPHATFTAVLLSAHSHDRLLVMEALLGPHCMQLGPHCREAILRAHPSPTVIVQPGPVLLAMCAERGHRQDQTILQTPELLLPQGWRNKLSYPCHMTLSTSHNPRHAT